MYQELDRMESLGNLSSFNDLTAFVDQEVMHLSGLQNLLYPSYP